MLWLANEKRAHIYDVKTEEEEDFQFKQKATSFINFKINKPSYFK